MFSVKVFQSINRLCSAKITTRLSSFSNLRQTVIKRKFSNNYDRKFDLKSHVENDAVLFRLERPKFFFYLKVFSGVQCVFWAYMGLFMLNTLNFNEDAFKERHFWRELLQKEQKYNTALCAVAIGFGIAVVVGTNLYTLRSVRKLVLNKGGKSVTIETYSVPGFNNVIEVPLSRVSAFSHRKHAKNYLPLKIKDKYFYYLLDLRGEFLNPRLFDFTAGMSRNFR